MALKHASQADISEVIGIIIRQIDRVKKLPIGIVVMRDEEHGTPVHHLNGRVHPGVYRVRKRPLARPKIVMVAHDG